MAYDESLGQRIREALAGDPAINEKKMFGGIAFLHRGLMFVGISDAAVMAPVGKANQADSVCQKHVRELDFHWQADARICLHRLAGHQDSRATALLA